MTQAVSCPDCQRQIVIDDSPQQNQLNQALAELEQQKKIPKMPSTVPRYLCEDGNCDTVHPNSRYNKRPKGKCNNCDQLNPHKEGKCLWCNQDEVESIDSEDLENMGIRLPD